MQPPPVQAEGLRTWPWSTGGPHRAAFAQACVQMLRQVEGLPGLGWEVSVRLAPSGWCVDRLLVGVETAGVAPARLSGLPQQLGMPAPLARDFVEELACASAVLLAVESGPEGVELRAYQDFGEAARGVSPSSGLAMRGCKWLAGAAATTRGRRVTEYRRLPLDVARMQQLLQDLPARPATLRGAWSVLGELAGRAADEAGRLDFLVASEAGRGRASGCVRLQESGLSLRDGLQAAHAIAAGWGVDESALQRLALVAGDRPMSWVAAGLDGSGEPFVTLYAVGHRHDAWAAARSSNA